jgi:hypothetical protein
MLFSRPMNFRRLTYYASFTISVLATIMLASAYFIGPRGTFAVPFLSLFVAISVLCIWCAAYVRQEPRLVRLALFWLALLSAWIPIAIFLLPAVT